MSIAGEVPRGEKMLYSGTDPESYITEYTLVYENKLSLEGGVGSEVCVMCLTAAVAWCRTIIEFTWPRVEDSGEVPREQKMLKGHLPRVIYITKYTSLRRQNRHPERYTLLRFRVWSRGFGGSS